MNTNNNDTTMYKAVACAIFVVLVTLIVLITVSSVRDSAEPNDLPGTSPTTNSLPTPPETTAVPVTTAPPVTTAAPVTTAPPVTTAQPAETEPFDPVKAPAANVSDDLTKFLAGFSDTVLGETEDAGPSYIDKLIFLGDSTTYGLRAYKMLGGGKETTQVWTPASGTLTLSQAEFATIVYPETNEQITIKEAVKKKQPEYLVITLGVNGVSFMKEDYFKSEYKKIIETVQIESPDTKIICQSMFPVAKTYKSLGSIDNEKIRTANRWIVEVADACGVKYIDTYSVLADKDGWLPETYHNGDGMHLNSTSFTLELENLRTHAFTE